MKKSVVILLLILQLFLLFIFNNIYSLFRGFEGVNLADKSNQVTMLKNFRSVKEIFFSLFLLMGIFVVITCFYLVILFKRSRSKDPIKEITPLQTYLHELKSSEQTLKDLVAKQKEHVVEKEELNKHIINNINSAIIFLNTANRITTFNTVAESLLKQSYANAKNNSLDSVLKQFPDLLSFIEDHIQTSASQEVESQNKVFWVDMVPIENIGQLILIKDITDEKRREEVDRVNKNFIMLGEMAAFLSHEIRNSLGVIYGYTKTIRTEPKKMDHINKEINFLSTMMDSFLNFSKPLKVENREPVNIPELIKKLAKDIGLKCQVPDREFQLENDAMLINSVFSNLMLNAKEAKADRVTVECKHDKYREIYFSDNGRGVDSESADKIWYPFFTTKEKGTGMGLALVRKIIHAMNGDISLHKSDSQGTQFKITFY